MSYFPYQSQSFYSTTNPSGFISSVSGSQPSTSLLSVPLTINTFGGLSALLGAPNSWIVVSVSGSTYKIPLFS